jgi:hypothetical protein
MSTIIGEEDPGDREKITEIHTTSLETSQGGGAFGAEGVCAEHGG